MCEYMKKVFLILLLTISGSIYAQTGTLTIHGRVENENTKVKDVNIEIVKDNQLLDEFTNNANGSYKVRLELGSIYNITFTKEGYVTKTIGVIAKTPDSLVTGVYFFQLDIDVFTLEDEDPQTVFPDVAQLILKGEKQGFVYDKQYVRWITGEFEEKKEETQEVK